MKFATVKIIRIWPVRRKAPKHEKVFSVEATNIVLVIIFLEMERLP